MLSYLAGQVFEDFLIFITHNMYLYTYTCVCAYAYPKRANSIFGNFNLQTPSLTLMKVLKSGVKCNNLEQRYAKALNNCSLLYLHFTK